MQMTWDKTRPFVDPERFSQVESFLKIQHREAEWWRNASIAYFQNFSKRPLPEGHEPPPHDLAYYKSLQFPYAPGQGKQHCLSVPSIHAPRRADGCVHRHGTGTLPGLPVSDSGHWQNIS
jgi:hypothetical protein